MIKTFKVTAYKFTVSSFTTYKLIHKYMNDDDDIKIFTSPQIGIELCWQPSIEDEEFSSSTTIGLQLFNSLNEV